MNIAAAIARALLDFVVALLACCVAWWCVRATRRVRRAIGRRYWRWRLRLYRAQHYADS